MQTLIISRQYHFHTKLQLIMETVKKPAHRMTLLPPLTRWKHPSVRNRDEMSSLPLLTFQHQQADPLGKLIICVTCGGRFPTFREIFRHQREKHHSWGYGLPLQPSPPAWERKRGMKILN